ncbi:DUF6808 domain-containing protein [Prevotella sp. MGM2]|jgi:hypothetical protein|uniref:DUF6808 domain-containing protein n=1 Tax=Prevotella sp. MGM2 TaxID=2033406 RepID=UPI000CEA1E75|nr:hypothetical protein [Prevotella sp. MGM2]GAY31531.1 hypothetical protein PvtlMGM2_2384 [Prevotella sp. MGM2]
MRSDTPRKIIRKVKDILAIVLVIVACMAAGAYLHKCQSPPGDNIPGREAIETDTITIYDTIPYIEPAPVHSQQVGSKKVTIPTSYIDRGIENLPDIRADTAELTSADVEVTTPDSLTLQLPITQNVYEGEDYKAYVSGVYPSLDSLFVYPRREIVTIKKPPKRWHIGPTVGFGYTPHGFEPFIGISLTYSIIDL